MIKILIPIAFFAPLWLGFVAPALNWAQIQAGQDFSSPRQEILEKLR